MSVEASPRPWHFNGMRPTIYSDEKLPDGSARVVLDIETDHLPLLPCDENDRRLIADLALIVDAVNERDRLRDIVRRMLPFVEKCHSDAFDLSKTIKGICALKGVDTSEIDRINSEHDALIAEARAAIEDGRRLSTKPFGRPATEQEVYSRFPGIEWCMHCTTDCPLSHHDALCVCDYYNAPGWRRFRDNLKAELEDRRKKKGKKC